MNLRPKFLSDFVGQKNVIKCLDILINASTIDQEPLPHLLFEGGPGLGKTTLALMMSKELSVDFQIVNGGSARNIRFILPYLMNLKPRSILFIDEIHRLGNLTSEFLYPAMEDLRVDVGDEQNRVSIDLPPFTLIGATTESGLLPAPLRDRFVQKFQLQYYNINDLVQIILKNAKKLSINISNDSAISLAKRSRGTPRVANHLLNWTKKYTKFKQGLEITNIIVEAAMNLIGIDQWGLDINDRKYLGVLKNSTQPLGIKTIVSITGISQETIEETIEPYLLKLKRIIKTNKGRILNEIL